MVKEFEKTISHTWDGSWMGRENRKYISKRVE